MITVGEAIKIYNKKYPQAVVSYISESPEYYIIGVKDSDTQGYDVVYKQDGRIDFISWYDYFKDLDNGYVNWVAVDEITD